MYVPGMFSNHTAVGNDYTSSSFNNHVKVPHALSHLKKITVMK